MPAPTFDFVADGIEEVVEAAGEAASQCVESAGHRSQDGLRRFGVPVRLGDVLAGVTTFVGATIKGAFGVVGRMVAGCIRIIGGILLMNVRGVLEGSKAIGSSIAGAVILIAGTFISLIQRTLFLQQNERPLTRAELILLKQVFRDSISLDNVRIVEGRCGLFGISKRPFVLGNTVYLKDADRRKRPDILVHEGVHVWQYQNIGARYAMDAVGAQAVYGRAAYDWRADLERGAVDWTEFNKEAQAALIQAIWTHGSVTLDGCATSGSGVFFNADDARERFGTVEAAFVVGGTDYTDLAKASVAALRGRASRAEKNPLRRWLTIWQ